MMLRAKLTRKNGRVDVETFAYMGDRFDAIIEQALSLFHVWLPEDLLYGLYESYDKLCFQPGDIVEFHFEDYSEDDYVFAYEGDDDEEPVCLAVTDVDDKYAREIDLSQSSIRRWCDDGR